MRSARRRCSSWLGIELTPAEIAEILQRLEFKTEIKDGTVHATAPDHRLDIGTGVIGVADLLEEIARIYGYERIPETRMAMSCRRSSATRRWSRRSACATCWSTWACRKWSPTA